MFVSGTATQFEATVGHCRAQTMPHTSDWGKSNGNAFSNMEAGGHYVQIASWLLVRPVGNSSDLLDVSWGQLEAVEVDWEVSQP